MKVFRRSQVRFILLAALLSFGAVKAIAAPVAISDFRGGVLFGLTGSEDIAPHVAWTPSVSAGVVGFRGELGAGYFLDGGTFVTNYELYLQLPLMPVLGVEAGAGFLTSHATGGSTNFIFGGNVTLGLVGPINYIYAGYSRLDAGTGSDIIRAGIGFSL